MSKRLKTSEKTRSSKFAIQCAGDEAVKQAVQDKLQQVRTVIRTRNGRPTDNAEALSEVLDFWLTSNTSSMNTSCSVVSTSTGNRSLLQLATDEILTEQVLMITSTSLARVVDIVGCHPRQCSGVLNISTNSTPYHGFAHKMLLSCSAKCAYISGHGKTVWNSPRDSAGNFVINLKLLHGFYTSGMLPVHFNRLFSSSGITSTSSFLRRTNLAKKYAVAASHVATESCTKALAEEKGEGVAIDILTDARHGWRKNSRQTDVVCLGNNTKKVIRLEMVTRQMDSAAQRHEKIGTEKIYSYLLGTGLRVNMHCHDSNTSITKYVREIHPTTINQLDNWHACKSFKKHVAYVTKGPRYKHGITWHLQLSDELGSLKLHLKYALHNCDNDAGKLQEILLNAVQHYKGFRYCCALSSRCRRQANYIPSKVLIEDPKAEALLTDSIKSSHVYKHAELYRMNASTTQVESFNNTLNVFQDKRIAFSNEIYQMRTDLAVCHWNENTHHTDSSSNSYDYRDLIFYKFIGFN